MPTTASDVAHLWRRAAFGISPAGAETRAGRSWETLVEELIDADLKPLTRPPELDDPLKADWERTTALIEGWLNHMAKSAAPCREKLALFFHGRIPTSSDKVGTTELLWNQLALVRSRSRGPVRNLMNGIVRDPAMMLYLDNVYNSKWNVNENFGRELLELFTLGVGNYTQDDVFDAARCMTGQGIIWETGEAHWYPEYHDTTNKTILGVTGNFGPTGLLDVLFNSTNKVKVARHLARSLWEKWAYLNPSTTLVNNLANSALDGGLSGRGLAAVLMHSEFRSTKARSAHVRTPIELSVALMKTTGLTAQDLGLRWNLRDIGNCPFEPPNVSGWPTSRLLMTTSSWWGMGGVHNDAAWTASGLVPLKMPNTRSYSATEAAERVLTYARISNPSAALVAQIASVISQVRPQTDARSERYAAHLAVTLTGAFGRN